MIERGPVVFDGAMGTLLYSRGIYINRNFDELNISRPDMVEKAHADYLSAGAMVLTTNTFGANEIKLGRFGLQHQCGEINRAGVRIAKSVAAGRAFVAGSIGPSGIVPDIFDPAVMEKLRNAFMHQADHLVQEGVDLLIFETFRYPVEMHVALEAVRSRTSVPIVASMTFAEDGRTADGMEPERVAALMSDWGADVVGANCGEGPSQIFEIAPRMIGAGKPVIAQANAGLPRVLDGRVIYMATPEYFGEYTKRFLNSGINIVGGCCGTTPDHIRQVSSEARMVSGGRVTIMSDHVQPADKDTAPSLTPPPLGERSGFGSCLSGGFVVSIEIDPPTGLDVSKIVDGARALKEAGVRFVNIADGPRATVRISALAMARILADQAGLEPILHATCRDRNLLGLQSDLLGAYAMGLRNLLIITGDPSKLGDYPDATTVYDLDSIGLLRLVGNLNHGIEPSGRRMTENTAFVMGCGAEPGAQDLDREIDRLRQKVEAGAEYVMTQPIFDDEVMETFLDRIAGIDVPVIMGLLPLASHRNAEFLHYEVPGMTIPLSLRERMRLSGTGQSARDEGVRICQETANRFMNRVSGLYLMPPFNRMETALAVLQGLSLPGKGGCGR